MDNANLPTSTIDARLPTQLTKWSPRLRLDDAEWDIELVKPEHIGELALLAERARAAWQQRATPAEMGEIFKRLTLACRGQPGESNDRKATVALMLRYLADYPAHILAAAADQWIKTKVFMPAIAELRELCEAEMLRLERAWRRATIIVDRSKAERDRRDAERDEAARLAADRAARTPEWWDEMHRRVQAIGADHAAFIDPKHAAAKANLSKMRDALRDKLTEMHKQQQAERQEAA